MKTIYLDYAAATPLDKTVAAAMQPYLSEKFYNPSATYLAAKEVARDVETARGRIAHWLGSRPSEIIFTAGGTEANNLAIHGVMQNFPGKRLLVSSIEHDAVLAPAKRYDHDQIPVTAEGLLDLAALEKLLKDDVVLVSVMYANNEVGTIQPIRQVAKLIAEVRQSRKQSGNDLPLYLHTDACQAAAYLDLHVSRLGVDLMTLNSGKIYGPKQSGALYVKAGVELQSQILGGGQERSMRSGTENVAGVVGFAAALDLVQARHDQEADRLRQLRDDFIKQLQARIPKIIVNGSLKHRLPNNLHVTIPGQDNERLLMALDEQGIICASGSACSASKEDASHVLRAMGVSDAAAYASLRFSLGIDTDGAAIKRTVDVLASLLD